MQKVVIDKPYQFQPPIRSNFWTGVVQRYVMRYLRKKHGITAVECRHRERLKASLDAGHGIVLAPNHSRLCDPLVLGPLVRPLRTGLFSMASWHLFNQDWFTTFIIRRIGSFSVYREGTDRQAINLAVEILETAERPLIIFPEGAVSRCNGKLMPLLDGTAFIARTAAKRRAKSTPGGKVVIHPIAIHYSFHGDLQAALDPVLTEFEERFSWQPQKQRPLLARISQIGEAILALKELEYIGEVQTGDVYDRLAALIEFLLRPLEKEWSIAESADCATHRVRRLRTAILPVIVQGETDEVERARLWRQLTACYYAQQMSHYLAGRLHPGGNAPEYLLETVERFEEDITDAARPHGELRTLIDVGEAIEVSPERDRQATSDPVMRNIEDQLNQMLQAAAAEVNASRPHAAEPQTGGPRASDAVEDETCVDA